MTNKIVLRSITEFLTGYKPAYIPLMPLFLGNGRDISYSVEAGKVTFQRAETVGDIRSKRIGPKDTEIHQIHSKEGSKEFKKYFFGSQFVQSNLQDTRGYEDVVAQVLDEHNKQNDEIFLGDGVNNGLFTSSDSNFVTKDSYEVAKDGSGDHLPDLYTKMVSLVEDANVVDGQKLVLVYGATMIQKYNGLFVANKTSFAKTLSDALVGTSFQKMPSAITPANENGFLIINMDQIKIHYTMLPGILGQGVNEEKMHTWTNFLMGSSMVECLASGAITKQPITFAA